MFLTVSQAIVDYYQEFHEVYRRRPASLSASFIALILLIYFTEQGQSMNFCSVAFEV